VGDANDLGGGQNVWTFDAGSLINVRSFAGGGASKLTFAVTRNGAGFDCTFNVLFGREVGVPHISWRARASGAWVELVSSKQISSSCEIAANDEKRPPPAGIKGAGPDAEDPQLIRVFEIHLSNSVYSTARSENFAPSVLSPLWVINRNAHIEHFLSAI
jgi:hypothetical protein